MLDHHFTEMLEELFSEDEVSQETPDQGDFQLEKTEAEVTLSEHLRWNSRKIRTLISETKLSQKYGVALFLAEQGSTNGLLWTERFQYSAPVDALIASIRTRDRLKEDPKFRSEMKHLLIYFDQAKPLERKELIRRVIRHRGYRDKGTLPDLNQKAIAEAQKESWINVDLMEERTSEFLKENLPQSLFEGEFLDLPETLIFLQEEVEILGRIQQILLQER